MGTPHRGLAQLLSFVGQEIREVLEGRDEYLAPTLFIGRRAPTIATVQINPELFWEREVRDAICASVLPRLVLDHRGECYAVAVSGWYRRVEGEFCSTLDPRQLGEGDQEAVIIISGSCFSCVNFVLDVERDEAGRARLGEWKGIRPTEAPFPPDLHRAVCPQG